METVKESIKPQRDAVVSHYPNNERSQDGSSHPTVMILSNYCRVQLKPNGYGYDLSFSSCFPKK